MNHDVMGCANDVQNERVNVESMCLFLQIDLKIYIS